ncbi:MAG: hypothetical protein WC712_03150 [Candidatus Brocadiia bacterium]
MKSAKVRADKKPGRVESDEPDEDLQAKLKERSLRYRREAEGLKSIVDASPLQANVLARLLSDALLNEEIIPDEFTDPVDRDQIAKASIEIAEMAARSRDLLSEKDAARADKGVSAIQQRPFLVEAINMARASEQLAAKMPRWLDYEKPRARNARLTLLLIFFLAALPSAYYLFDIWLGEQGLDQQMEDGLFRLGTAAFVGLIVISATVCYFARKKLPPDFDQVHGEILTLKQQARGNDHFIWAEIRDKYHGTSREHLQSVLDQQDAELAELMGTPPDGGR